MRRVEDGIIVGGVNFDRERLEVRGLGIGWVFRYEEGIWRGRWRRNFRGIDFFFIMDDRGV